VNELVHGTLIDLSKVALARRLCGSFSLECSTSALASGAASWTRDAAPERGGGSHPAQPPDVATTQATRQLARTERRAGLL